MAEGKIKKLWNSLVGSTPISISKQKPKAYLYGSGTYRTIYSTHFDGEKNLGEIGPIKDYWLDYDALRARSWQSYIESEIAQTVLKKFTMWVIGPGLKLQAEPQTKVLEYEGITLDSEEFNESVETRFSLFAHSEDCDYSGMQTMAAIEEATFLNAIIGGDVLVVQRYDERQQVTVQLIDGVHLRSPMGGGNDYSIGYPLENGNVIRCGIELSPKGEHIAYHVCNRDLSYTRIPARTEDGLITAFLVYGSKYRLDNHRGIPLISTVLETLKKLERYKEATVGSAEERQKIAYSIEHDLGSTGENPLVRNLAKAINPDADTDEIPLDVQGKQLADTVAATTNKQAFNMPIGSHLKALESKGELYFKDFYTINIDVVCAALGIPPEVAMSRYNSNFSASRAALKDWEHTINVNRKKFSAQFKQRIYAFWLHVQILLNKIYAPGYMVALVTKNNVVLSAYRLARFVGANVPHIDPLKEVSAERLKLGTSGAAIPLTTVEAATEALNGGDSDQNMLQYADELEQAEKLGIKLEQQTSEPTPDQEE